MYNTHTFHLYSWVMVLNVPGHTPRRKRDKVRGLRSIISLFCNEFNKFNKTGKRMIDFIYQSTLGIREYGRLFITLLKFINHL